MSVLATVQSGENDVAVWNCADEEKDKHKRMSVIETTTAPRYRTSMIMFHMGLLILSVVYIFLQ